MYGFSLAAEVGGLNLASRSCSDPCRGDPSLCGNSDEKEGHRGSSGLKTLSRSIFLAKDAKGAKKHLRCPKPLGDLGALCERNSLARMSGLELGQRPGQITESHSRSLVVSDRNFPDDPKKIEIGLDGRDKNP